MAERGRERLGGERARRAPPSGTARAPGLLLGPDRTDRGDQQQPAGPQDPSGLRDQTLRALPGVTELVGEQGEHTRPPARQCREVRDLCVDAPTGQRRRDGTGRGDDTRAFRQQRSGELGEQRVQSGG